MNRSEAVQRMTKVATRAGQPITSDETFELFAALVPDSPWSMRLLRLRDIFNDLATAAVMINAMEPIKKWNEAVEADPTMADDPELKTMHAAFTLLQNAMTAITPSVGTPSSIVPATPAPSPVPQAARYNDVDKGLDELLTLLDPSHATMLPVEPLDINDLARQAGAMRYQSEVPNFGSVSGWSFRDKHLEAFVEAIRSHGA